MIQTGRRLFKGYDDYDDLLRMEWDLETEGLDPEKDAISQIGIRTNKGYEKILTVEGEGEQKKENEFKAICEFFEIIEELQPDVITGHNTENFDWNFVDVRLKLVMLIWVILLLNISEKVYIRRRNNKSLNLAVKWNISTLL